MIHSASSMKKFALLAIALTLSGCGKVVSPGEIGLLGVASGTVEDSVEELAFGNQFAVSDRNLIAVVGFKEALDNGTVQATWFSPDDRRMPLGRKNIELGSGANIARFTLQSTEDWKPSPFKLIIRLYQDLGTGEQTVTASGSVQFFVGMEEDDIRTYLEELAEYDRRKADERTVREKATEQDEYLMSEAKILFDSKDAIIATRFDFDGDESADLIIADRAGLEEMNLFPTAPILFQEPVQQFTIVSHSGDELLSLVQDGRSKVLSTRGKELLKLPSSTIGVLLLSSGTLSLTWEEDDRKSCSAELVWNDGFILERTSCLPL